jgi:hypothetical protein
MKNAMFIALFLGVFGIAFGRTEPVPSDSLVILFGKSTRIIIHARDREELKALKNYDFNALLNQVITVMETDNRRDTSIVLDGDTIVMKGGEVVIRGGKEKEAVTFSIRIGGKEGAEIEVSGNDTTVVVNRDRERRRRTTRKEFTVDLGLNNYLENGKLPDVNDVDYALRPWGSRYIAVGYEFRTRLTRNRNPLVLRYGLEASFNNFMFDSDRRLVKTSEGVAFADVPDAPDLKKSKLTVIYASLPVMPVLHFNGSHNSGFRIGIGGYVGYRVHSYTKIMYFREGDKQKDHQAGNYYLNSFRYGLQAMIGFRDVSLFAKYDLNPLFANGRGPTPNDLNALSFGIRL